MICPGEAVPPSRSMLYPPCPSALAGPGSPSTSTARTTGGRCWYLTSLPCGLAPQRAVRCGRQPGDGGARGEAKDAQASAITRILRHGTLASVPLPRAPARVRQAPFDWVAYTTTSRVVRRRRARSGGVSHF